MVNLSLWIVLASHRHSQGTSILATPALLLPTWCNLANQLFLHRHFLLLPVFSLCSCLWEVTTSLFLFLIGDLGLFVLGTIKRPNDSSSFPFLKQKWLAVVCPAESVIGLGALRPFRDGMATLPEKSRNAKYHSCKGTCSPSFTQRLGLSYIFFSQGQHYFYHLSFLSYQHISWPLHLDVYSIMATNPFLSKISQRS